MKLRIIILSYLLCTFVSADEYRYDLMVTTGLQERVFDEEGKATMVSFSKKSNAKALFILSKILRLGGISGTKDGVLWRGVPFEQAILIKGELDPKVLRTGSAANTAEAEDYQEFTLEEVRVRFPISRHREGKVFDTGYLETHFSFATLFPDGLIFEGQEVDFIKHTAKSK